MTDTYRIPVRFPEEMRAVIKQAAKADARSVNSLVVAAVARYANHVLQSPVQAAKESQRAETVDQQTPAPSTSRVSR